MSKELYFIFRKGIGGYGEVAEFMDSLEAVKKSVALVEHPEDILVVKVEGGVPVHCGLKFLEDSCGNHRVCGRELLNPVLLEGIYKPTKEEDQALWSKGWRPIKRQTGTF